MNKVKVLTLSVVLLSSGLVFAQQAAPTAQAEVKPLEVGNKFCPVTGNKIGEMGPPVKFIYNGKVYNIGCSACVQSFKDNPEKYSKIADDGVASQK